MIPIEQQGAVFFVAGSPTNSVWLPISSDTTLETIRDDLVDAGIAKPDTPIDNILMREPDGELAQAAAKVGGGKLVWGLLTSAIDLAERGKAPFEAIAAWVGNTGDIDCSSFMDEYVGRYDSLAVYAKEMTRASVNLDKVPAVIRAYIDYEKMGEDFERSGDIWFADSVDGVFVFRV